jgi:hypothetical protein
MKITLDTDFAQIRDRLGNLARQADFAASVALNATARHIQAAIPATLRSALDRPTPFTGGEPSGPRTATYIARADKRKLEAAVLFKARQAEYLQYQVEGGTRYPKRKALRLPSAIETNAFGNLPRNAIKQLLAVARRERKLTRRQARTLRVSRTVEIFYGDPTDIGLPGSPPGIYKRVYRPGGRNQLIPLIVMPARPAQYQARIDLGAMAEPIVRREMPREWARALEQALRTARPDAA